jgi:hypothetical protein
MKLFLLQNPTYKSCFVAGVKTSVPRVEATLRILLRAAFAPLQTYYAVPVPVPMVKT